MTHTCELTLLHEGEAVCLGCGAYYIFQAVLSAAEMEEVMEEIAAEPALNTGDRSAVVSEKEVPNG